MLKGLLSPALSSREGEGVALSTTPFRRSILEGEKVIRNRKNV